MLKIALWLYVGGLVWGSALCSVRCPDGHACPDRTTCCMTSRGYSCCPYPKAVCCADRAHCCPMGYRCNMVTKMCEKTDQPWLSIPMASKEAAQEPSAPDLSVTPLQESSNVPEEQKSSVVRCDLYHVCPDGTTCCRHPKGVWFCCGYVYGRCCLDGFHCCPHGYDCDLTYTHCVRGSLRYPFSPKPALTSVPASYMPSSDEDSSTTEEPLTALVEASTSNNPELGVIRCDSSYHCPGGSTCCKGAGGQWTCCPYPLGTCCADGKHCCQYGYTCDPTSSTCRSLWGTGK